MKQNKEVDSMKNLKRLVIMALMAALTMIATMAIQIPTPLSGYIHLGDSIVLLSGIILGPVGGAVAAGIGSMMADIVTGYFIYAPATLIIKSLAAFVIGLAYRKMTTISENNTFHITVSGFLGAIVMVLGYFIYEIFLYGVVASAANMIFNAFQGVASIIVAIPLLPVLFKIPDVKILMTYEKASHN